MTIAGKLRDPEWLFRASVVLKGLHGILEIVSGAALLAVSPSFIRDIVVWITRNELVEDPHDLVANAFLHAAQNLSLHGQRFGAIYLLSHGVVKIALVAALLQGRLWAYPAAIAVFGAFIVYQLYRFTLTHGWFLIVLSVFDLVVVGLIVNEYRLLSARRRGARDIAGEDGAP